MIPLLKYNYLSEIFSLNGINKEEFDSSIVLSNFYIYFIDSKNILYKSDKIGNKEKIAIIDNPNIFVNYLNDIVFVQNGKITQENKQTSIVCSKKFTIIDKFSFVCVPFLEKEIIIKYDIESEKEICRSQIIDPVQDIMGFGNCLAAKTEECLCLFDLSLMFMNNIIVTLDSFSINKYIFVTKNNFIDQYLVCFNKEKPSWEYKIDGQSKMLVTTDNFVICSTDISTFCFDHSGKIIWIKKPAFNNCVPFFNQTEHIVAVKDNRISIYEIQTGVLVWQNFVEYPICGKPVIDKNGIAISTYNGGGIHYFGAEIWKTDF